MSKTEDQLRADVGDLIQASLDAVHPSACVRRALSSAPLQVRGRVAVVAFGKAAASMLAGLPASIRKAARGVVISPQPPRADVMPGLTHYAGDHPLPGSNSVAGTRAVVELVRSLGAEDTLIALVSGGGSSMLSLPPPELRLEDIQTLTSLLLTGGASIQHINEVRRELDLVKGGKLARLAYPARTWVLVLSDVPGDHLASIASGPFFDIAPDPRRALAHLVPFGDGVPARVRSYLETAAQQRDSPAPVGYVQHRIVGCGTDAARQAVQTAQRLGYVAATANLAVDAEAGQWGNELARQAARTSQTEQVAKTAQGLGSLTPRCWVHAGETRVQVRGSGRGGRNQQVALGAVGGLAGLPAALVLSIGTDGIDGPTDAAGALATGSTLARAEALGLSARKSLEQNNAYPFFDALGDLVRTGPTGTNVADLQIVLHGGGPKH